MNKKIGIILGVIILLVITVIAIVMLTRNNNKYMEIANVINSNSNLPVSYMSKYDKDLADLANYTKTDNYMSKDYRSDDIFFSYYGYPNDESEYLLGEISLTSNKYNILGISIGDNMKQAIEKIQEYGFELEENNNDLIATFVYEDFSIKLEAEMEDIEEQEKKIEVVTLKANSKYLGNRNY